MKHSTKVKFSLSGFKRGKLPTMKVKSLQLIVFVNLINFAALVQLDLYRYYKPSGERKVHELDCQVTSQPTDY